MWADRNILVARETVYSCTGTGEENAINESIPAGRCGNADVVHGLAAFELTSSGNTKTFKVIVGSTTIFSIAVTTPSTTKFMVQWWLLGIPASTSKLAHVWYTDPATGAVLAYAETAVTADLHAAWTAKVTVQGGAAGEAKCNRAYWARSEGRY